MWITGAGYADFFFVLASKPQMQDTGGCLDSFVEGNARWSQSRKEGNKHGAKVQ